MLRSMNIICYFSEISDISRGRRILTDLVERNSVPIFTKIEVALQCTKTLLRKVRSHKPVGHSIMHCITMHRQPANIWQRGSVDFLKLCWFCSNRLATYVNCK